MDDNILKQLWQHACVDQRVEIDPEKLIESLNKNITIMEKLINRRDAIEIGVSSLLILLFGWGIFTMPNTLAKIGAGIIVASCGLIIYRLVKARWIKIQENPAAEIRYHLQVSLQKVRQQKSLLNSVLWWYLLPLFIGVECLSISSLSSFSEKVLYTALVVIVYGYIYYLNKRVVKNRLQPLENELTKMLEEFSE